MPVDQLDVNRCHSGHGLTSPTVSDDPRVWERSMVARIAAGDDSALAAVYDQYGPLVHGIAVRLVGSNTAADVSQEVFVALWEHPERFDAERGTISRGRVLVTIADDVGAPDGMTVDAAGDLWVAIYGGGCVQRFSPDGELRQVLSVPAEQTTSCAFAGPGLHWLYVTTGTEGWSEHDRAAEPGAGVVYRLDTDATGRPAEHVDGAGFAIVGREYHRGAPFIVWER